MTGAVELLRKNPVVAVLRAPDASRFLDASHVLYEAGLRCLEFTMTTDGVLDALAEARKALPDDTVLGVGTVRTSEHVHQAAGYGADFLVSQLFPRDAFTTAQRLGVPFVPGALTPTEIAAAFDAGAEVVKVSPVVSVGGVGYVDELRGPLPDVPVLVTGGVELDEPPRYLESGAAGVGLSRTLFLDSLVNGDDLDGLGRRARRVVESVAKYL